MNNDEDWEEDFYLRRVEDAAGYSKECAHRMRSAGAFSPEKRLALKEEIARRWPINEAFEVNR
jgi:hypothetical protein